MRPKQGYEEQIASVPYDVINTEEARQLTKNNPFSFLHVIKPEVDLPLDADPYDDRVYRKGAENFAKMKREGFFIEENAPALYLYKIQMGGQEQIGIACCSSLEEYEKDIIKKHEHTRKVKEDDRVRHMQALSAHTGPVLLIFRGTEELDTLFQQQTKGQPLYDFEAADNIKHTIWKVSDTDAIREAFEKVPSFYIADGHHRAAAAARVKAEREKSGPIKNDQANLNSEYNYFLTVLFPSDQLKIFPYNRYITDIGNGTKNRSDREFLQAVRERCTLYPTDKKQPETKGTVCMYHNDRWYEIRIDKEKNSNDPVAALDLSWFQRTLLEDVFGVIDQRHDDRIDFVGGPGSPVKLEKMVDEQGGVAFTFFPVSVDELLAVADAHMIMPPKSTWFAPKLRSGLLIHPF